MKDAQTATLARCVTAQIAQLADAVDLHEVHRVVANITPHILELHRRSETITEKAKKTPTDADQLLPF